MSTYFQGNNPGFAGAKFRYVLMAVAFFGFIRLPGVSLAQTNAWVRPPVTIYEVCIKPERLSQPKWVKLRSFSEQDINLKGYSLHDRSTCFYRFEEDCVLEARKTLTLFFHSGLRRSSSVNYPRDFRYGAKHIVVTNSDPFSAKAELSDSYWKRTYDKYAEGRTLDNLEFLTFEQYDYVGRLADEYRGKYGLTNVSKAVVMSDIALYALYRESDEVALVDSGGKIASFVGWGDGTYLQQPATSKWEKAAMEAGLSHGRQSIVGVDSGDNVFGYPHIILERSGANSRLFLRMPFGTPGDTQCKDPIRKLVLSVEHETGGIHAEVMVRSSQDRWKFVLELATRSDFKEVVCRKEENVLCIWNLEQYPLCMEIKLSEEEIRALGKQSRWYYRARREFNDGENTEWTAGMEVIYKNTWLKEFGDTPSAMIEGLIEARKKSEAKKPPTSSPVPKPDPKPQ
ncbi:MAG: hypothetical protein C0404_11075 [Verrucomicrobia bacterium]|nr:hypothetical protein [Verrucomicrobiota bacterium]